MYDTRLPEFQLIETVVPHCSLPEAELEDFELFLVGCTCDSLSTCSESPSCSCRIQSPLSYTDDHLLKCEYLTQRIHPPIVECGQSCSCSSRCLSRLLSPLGTSERDLDDSLMGFFDIHKMTQSAGVEMSPFEASSRDSSRNFPANRLVNYGALKSGDDLQSHVRLGCIFGQIFSCANKGYGVKTLSSVNAGKLVCEYVGEVISHSEAKLREKDPSSKTYLFVIQESSTSFHRTTYIDARFKGNYARFINHSCDPNLVLLPVRVDTIVPRLVFFAKRHIEAGEELTVDYGQGELSSGLSSVKCACASRNCKGYLPVNVCVESLLSE